MRNSLSLPRYSIGVGDRFAQQSKAQLAACIKAAKTGVAVTPVWNKSNREHTIVGSAPEETRGAADWAVEAVGWKEPYFVDADHISLKTVDGFIGACDFFTIDVADFIGRPAEAAGLENFVTGHSELSGELNIPGIDRVLSLPAASVTQIAGKYLAAVQEAGRIYRHIADQKGAGQFITEVSMDETDSPQTPVELLVILAAIAAEKIPLQTIAPKFTGRFNKGVDYQGDVNQFAAEFSDDIAVIAYAVRRYRLPLNLKLSVHSGSDKFSVFGPIHSILKKSGAGVHLKTAGTTWLEELIGLAEAGGMALDMAKQIYAEAYSHREELCAPYASVVDIDPERLPDPEKVARWSSKAFAATLRHDPRSEMYNSSFRQLLHVAFKVAAKLGPRYLDMVSRNAAIIARNVTDNLFDRHIKPVFIGE